jgi:HK97 family phage prohead protease
VMDGLYIRAVASDLEVTGDGRTVTGLLAPYNTPAKVDDGFGPYWEMFERGCFSRALRGNASYLRLQLEHNGHWVGRGSVWRDSAEGLAADMRLDDTEAGREAAFKIRDGQTPGLSVAYRLSEDPQGNETRPIAGKKVTVRKKIKALHHVALCQFPAYAQAQVEAVRSAPPDGPPDRLAYWQDWTVRMRRT